MLTFTILILSVLAAHSLWSALQEAPFGAEDGIGFRWNETRPWQALPSAFAFV